MTIPEAFLLGVAFLFFGSALVSYGADISYWDSVLICLGARFVLPHIPKG